MRIAFWNIHKNPRTLDAIVELVYEHDVDILIIAEAGSLNEALLVMRLSSVTNTTFRFSLISPSIPTKIRVFDRLRKGRVTPKGDDLKRSVSLSVVMPCGSDLNLLASHLRDVRSDGRLHSIAQAARLTEFLANSETNAGHKRSLLIGDLNMSPFDHGMQAVTSLNTTMDSRIAANGPKKYQGKNYDYLYNPMWSLMGDRSKGPPGTYFYKEAAGGPQWHMIDQVLIRPDLLLRWTLSQLQIIDKTSSHKLVTALGRPCKAKYSDHLPIVLTLEKRMTPSIREK